MTTDRSAEYLNGLVRELCKQPTETEWLEFKHNNADPQEIGEYLSALSNSAALCGKANAYLVWGIENDTHAIVGTTLFFDEYQSGRGRAGKLATEITRAQDTFSILLSGDGSIPSGVAGNRTGIPTPGTVPKSGVHPGRILQKEAEGFS